MIEFFALACSIFALAISIGCLFRVNETYALISKQANVLGKLLALTSTHDREIASLESLFSGGATQAKRSDGHNDATERATSADSDR